MVMIFVFWHKHFRTYSHWEWEANQDHQGSWASNKPGFWYAQSHSLSFLLPTTKGCILLIKSTSLPTLSHYLEWCTGKYVQCCHQLHWSHHLHQVCQMWENDDLCWFKSLNLRGFLKASKFEYLRNLSASRDDPQIWWVLRHWATVAWEPSSPSHQLRHPWYLQKWYH